MLVENGLATDGGAAAAAATEDAASGKAKRKSKTEALVGTPLERCAGILEALMKRRDAQDWFCEPVPEGTDGYADVVKSPMDYGTIQSKIKSGAYAAPAAFAADVRLVAANAVAYSPELDNDCNRAARANRYASGGSIRLLACCLLACHAATPADATRLTLPYATGWPLRRHL